MQNRELNTQLLMAKEEARKYKEELLLIGAEIVSKYYCQPYCGYFKIGMYHSKTRYLFQTETYLSCVCVCVCVCARARLCVYEFSTGSSPKFFFLGEPKNTVSPPKKNWFTQIKHIFWVHPDSLKLFCQLIVKRGGDSNE